MTQDEIIEITRQAGGFDATPEFLERFAHLVAAKEREACAKVVESIEAQCIAKDVDDPPLKHVAAAIRARGEQA